MVAALRCLLCRELSTPSLAAFHIHCFLHCVPWRPSSVLLLDLVCLQEDLLGWPFIKSLNLKKRDPGFLRSASILSHGWDSQVAAEAVLHLAWVGAGSVVIGFARTPVPLPR